MIEKHDEVLTEFFNGQPFEKLYSFHTILDGFAVRLTAEQVDPVSFIVYVNCDRKQLTTPMRHFLLSYILSVFYACHLVADG